MSQVLYRLIDGFPGYRVGDDGSVWSLWIQRTRRQGVVWQKLSPRCNARTGYPQIYLRSHGKRKSVLVHKLVLTAFVGPAPLGQECRHLDGSRNNNRLDNLCWGTVKENAEDTVRHGRTRRGESNHNAKLTAEVVRLIRAEHAAGALQRDIAARHGIHQPQVSVIIRREGWRHV